MLLLFLLVYIKGCILSDSNDVFTNGFPDGIQWVYVQDYENFNLDCCKFVVASSPSRHMGDVIDSLLVEYVKQGGNLYFESNDFTGYPKLQGYVQYLASKPYTEDSLKVIGKGVFAGLEFELSQVPELFFTLDTASVLNYLEIGNVPIIGESVILYAFSLGKGSVVVSSFPFMRDRSYGALRERIAGYFFPDIAIVTDSIDGYWSGLVERMYEEDHVFVRMYESEFQGIPSGKLVIVDVPQNVVGPDSVTILYMGPFVCSMFTSCDTVNPYITFYLRGTLFELQNFETLALRDGEKNEVVFVNEAGRTIGFVLKDEKVGFLPFRLKDLAYEDRERFLLKLSTFNLESADVKERLDYFKGPLRGVFSDAEDIMVFTIDGRVAYKSQGKTGVVYNFTSLPDGLYIIKLRLNTGKDSLMLLNKLQGEGQ